MTMQARKFDPRPQQDHEAALELLTTSDFYAPTSERPHFVRDRRTALPQPSRGQGLSR
jgi:hypothetical protein